ncbi:MAG TPA: FtsQ-type POTRA domain-containing protein [Chitinivibrionales bacterium]|nr:FtsQ-type POTRA domain-containing protein [Chitinivibrionales bacterium]
MHRRMGANKRRMHGERRHAAGSAMKKAAARAASFSTAAVIAVCVCGGAVIGAVKAVSWVNQSPLFTVATIRVEGAVRVDQAEAVRLSGIKPGMRMTAVNPRACEQGICRNAWVRGAKVSRHFPNTVVLRLTERTPIALVNAGRVRYTDDCGVLLPLFSCTYSNLPVVSGLGRDSAGCLAGASVLRLKRFLDDCNNEAPLLAKRISQIDFSQPGAVRLRMEDVDAMVEMNDAQARVGMRRLARLADVAGAGPSAQQKRINLCYENLAFVQ